MSQFYQDRKNSKRATKRQNELRATRLSMNATRDALAVAKRGKPRHETLVFARGEKIT